MNTPAWHYDVLIVGGGLVGASLAVALRELPLKIGLVEAYAFADTRQPSYDDRPTALALGSQRVLAHWGLWPALQPHAAAIRQVHVSQAGYFGVTRINASDYSDANDAVLGQVVENRRIGQALAAALQTQANLSLHMPASFKALQQDDAQVQVTIATDAGEQKLSTRLLIGADGADSRVRQAVGINARQHDYQQRAIIANVSPARDVPATAYERFTSFGPLALLPMTPGPDGEPRRKLVWTHPADLAAARMQCSDAVFLQDLQVAFGQRLGQFIKLGERVSFALQQTLAERAVSGRVLLLGNAAHSLHPVAAQGFNLSLRDVVSLAELLEQAADPGAEQTLQAYLQARLPDQQKVAGFTDRIVRLFETRLPGAGHARAVGLLGLDLLPGVKRDLALRNMGLGPGAPRLARSVP